MHTDAKISLVHVGPARVPRASREDHLYPMLAKLQPAKSLGLNVGNEREQNFRLAECNRFL